MDKTELRKNAKKRIRELKGKTGESERIMENLKSLREYNEAETILAFFPLSDEPDIIPLIKSDPRVLFPYIDKGAMHFGSAHILHRSAYGTIEGEHIEEDYDSALMLVPLLGYSSTLQRLGRGGGFYDRYIAENRERITAAIGIAFSVSLLEEFIAEDHDAVLDMIITPDSVVRNPAS